LLVKLKAVFLTEEQLKWLLLPTMRMNAEGIKVQISGRLNGAEMARSENFKEGRIPYQLSELILIMHLLKHILLMVEWVLKYGL
jgi:hypothetical protein